MSDDTVNEATTARVSISVDQDRLTLKDRARDASLYVQQSQRVPPLSTSEPHADLVAMTDHGKAVLELDGNTVERLIAVLEQIQENYEE